MSRKKYLWVWVRQRVLRYNTKSAVVLKNIFLGQVQWLTPIIPAFWEAEADRSPEVRSLRPAWPTWQNPISTKNTKISQVWWQVPEVPATWEAEAGNLLNPGGRGYSELRSRHCTPAWATESNSISKKKKKEKRNAYFPICPFHLF